MTAFQDAGGISVGYLGPDTPLGYFRTLGDSHASSQFWVVEAGGTKSAIILAASDADWLFEAFPLDDDDDTDWTGASLGEVEVRVDLDSGTFYPSPQYTIGAITIVNGAVRISARPKGRRGSRITFEVGASVANLAVTSGSFTRWQLVQRDFARKPVILYEKS